MAKKAKARSQNRLLGRRRVSVVAVVLFALITAGVGYFVLRGSFAYDESNHANMGVTAIDRTNNQGIPGVQVDLTDANGGHCQNMGATTSDGSFGQERGTAYFIGCDVYPPYAFNIKVVKKAGYHIDPSSTYRPGGNGVTTAVGFEPHWPMYMIPDETDGDGIYDINDACPNQVGPSSNKGCPAPSISSFGLSSASVAYNGTTTLSWATTATAGCSITNVGAVAASGSYTTPALTKGTTYTLTCAPQYSYGAGNVTKSVSVAVGSAPVGSGGGGGTTKAPAAGGTKGTVSTQTQKQATPAPGSGGGSSSDTEPPSAPSNLTSTSTNTSVNLHWDASSDNTGVTAYVIQRSTDQQNWDTLSENTTDTNYQDSSIDFSTHYFYRVYAKDAAGNTSDAAVTELDTGSFKANVQPDQDATITNSDGSISAFIPAGATKDPLYCEISDASDVSPALTKKQKALVSPQRLLCKKENGDEVTDFAKAVKITIELGDQAKKASSLYFVNDNKWVVSDNTKAQNGKYEFDMQSTKPFMVLAASNSSGMLLISLLVILLILAIIGFIFWRRRSGGGDSGYNDLIATQYPTQTTAPTNGPLADVPTPGAPTPGSSVGGTHVNHSVDAGGHAPGQHQIDVSATPVGANPFHNPLDRLRAMEEAQQHAAPTKEATDAVKAPGDTTKDPNDFLETLKAPGEGLDHK